MQAADGLPEFRDELELLTDAARAAGEVALAFFRRAPAVWLKVGDSPVSEADLAVDRMLADRLLAARPAYGWLSEERDDAGTRLTAPRTFIVDPIDGTRDFIAEGTAWTIPLAVVEAGRPVAAVVYAPARNEMYRATLGGGATRNGDPIRVSGRRGLTGATVSGPRRLFRPPYLPEEIAVTTVFYASLAYRLARVADGRLDAAAVKASAQDWDLAAADLLVHEAGGLVTDLDGAAIRYDRMDTAHPPIIAATPALAPELTALVREALAAQAPEGQ